MIRLVLVITTYLVTMICQGQVSETRKLDGFSGIEVQTGIELIFTQKNSQSIKVETDDAEKMQKIKTVVNAGILKVFVKSNKDKSGTNRFKVLKVYVSQKDINSFGAGSGGSIKIIGEVNTDKMLLNLNSGSSFSGKIQSKIIDLKLSSGSRFDGNIVTNTFNGDFGSGSSTRLVGKSKQALININSGASCDAQNFSVDDVVVQANSAASISITANQSLKANASSASKIHYYGSPEKVEIKNHSSAKIVKK
ncbi:head GIN domain-containing protein [Flavobacterium sp. W1B]|uniref:head GIN domain-containing protein n=1 Tax=Flavobacterium sp. W1B TaxID=3394146 RepID=UPI0039BD5D03